MKTRAGHSAEKASTRSKIRGRSTVDAALGRAFTSNRPPKINPRWRWHYQTLITLRDRLFSERGMHRADVAQALETHSMDLADTATDEFDHDLALASLSNEQDSLYEVDDAINRILKGTYGICEATGKPIPAARLRAIPWARFRREVEERFESAKMIKKPHIGNVRSLKEEPPADLEESEAEEEKPEPIGGDESLREISLPRSVVMPVKRTPSPVEKSKRKPSPRSGKQSRNGKEPAAASQGASRVKKPGSKKR